MSWREFIQHNVDKIILLFVIHAMVVVMMNTRDASLIEWIRVEASGVIGALLMLITGRSSKPDPTASLTTTSTVSTSQPPPPESSAPNVPVS